MICPHLNIFLLGDVTRNEHGLSRALRVELILKFLTDLVFPFDKTIPLRVPHVSHSSGE